MRGFKHFIPVLTVHSADLTIRGIGVQEHMPPCIIDRPKGTGDYLLMLFYEDVWIGGKGAPARQPCSSMMIWSPGEWQYYGDQDKPYTHTWLHCDGRFIRSILRDTRLPCNQPFVVSDPAIMERHLLAMHEELTQHARPDGVIVRNLLENWLRSTARLAFRKEPQATDIPAPFLAIRHLIESEYAQAITLPELAERVHLSVPHFCAEFKRHFGTSAIDYLIRQRMHQSSYLLRDRNLRVAEVARRVGYEDLYYFSRLFRKHFGVSPRKFRLQEVANITS